MSEKTKASYLKTKSVLLSKTFVFVLFILTIFVLGYILLFAKPYSEGNVALVNMDYELGIIKSDLQTYNKLSDENINDILNALKETAIRDTLPVGLLHCINRVESEYQFNIIHPVVNVLVKGKMITTNAVGTGGIMWVYWGDSLKKYRNIQMESDLFFPVKSIKATGYILRWMINDELRISRIDTARKINSLNILSKIVKRYYGAYSDIYLSRMQNVTSDLWMKRIANDIINKKDTVANHVILNKETIKKE